MQCQLNQNCGPITCAKWDSPEIYAFEEGIWRSNCPGAGPAFNYALACDNQRFAMPERIANWAAQVRAGDTRAISPRSSLVEKCDAR
jgi:hypothetical protein